MYNFTYSVDDAISKGTACCTCEPASRTMYPGMDLSVDDKRTNRHSVTRVTVNRYVGPPGWLTIFKNQFTAPAVGRRRSLLN